MLMSIVLAPLLVDIYATGRAAFLQDSNSGSSIAVPFKSKAQRRKFAELLVEGKISPATYEEWNRETGRAKLPERVKPKAQWI